MNTSAPQRIPRLHSSWAEFLRTLPSLAALGPAAALAWLASPTQAQIVNPAEAIKPPPKVLPTADEMLETDQIPSTTVTAKRVSEYREEDLVGPYEQPEWTTHRRFTTTRVYVRPPDTFAFEFWLRPTIPRDGATETRTQFEAEVGLPGRFQLDLYATSNSDGQKGSFGFNEQSVELRWAFADWDVIALNPTLYLEYTFNDQDPDAIEGKLLLGDEASPGWVWGVNLVYEREISGALANTYEITAGISHTLVDERFSLGAEVKGSITDEHGSRGDFTNELLIGPSLQYRSGKHVHMDFAPLVGIGADSPAAQIFFVMGYEF
jgi:hypothetical protein